MTRPPTTETSEFRKVPLLLMMAKLTTRVIATMACWTQDMSDVLMGKRFQDWRLT